MLCATFLVGFSIACALGSSCVLATASLCQPLSGSLRRYSAGAHPAASAVASLLHNTGTTGAGCRSELGAPCRSASWFRHCPHFRQTQSQLQFNTPRDDALHYSSLPPGAKGTPASSQRGGKPARTDADHSKQPAAKQTQPRLRAPSLPQRKDRCWSPRPCGQDDTTCGHSCWSRALTCGGARSLWRRPTCHHPTCHRPSYPAAWDGQGYAPWVTGSWTLACTHRASSAVAFSV